MGWTSKSYRQATHENFSGNDLKSFLEDEFYGDYEFARVSLRKAVDRHDNHVCYAIMRNRKGQVFICVILINIKDGEIYWKEIEEDMGPSESDCPTFFFQFVPVRTDGGYAVEWRERCQQSKAVLERVI